jgi:hypothetical protein
MAGGPRHTIVTRHPLHMGLCLLLPQGATGEALAGEPDHGLPTGDGVGVEGLHLIRPGDAAVGRRPVAGQRRRTTPAPVQAVHLRWRGEGRSTGLAHCALARSVP